MRIENNLSIIESKAYIYVLYDCCIELFDYQHLVIASYCSFRLDRMISCAMPDRGATL